MAGKCHLIAPGDMRAYFDTLNQLRTLLVHAIAPAHGRVLDAPAAEIDHIIAHRRQREAQVVALLSDEPATVAELTAGIYPDIPEELQRMAQAQLTAHLLKLEAEGSVGCDAGQRWRCLS